MARVKEQRNGYTDAVQLLTFGHGTQTQGELAALIDRAGLSDVVDVRTVPKSRTHPWVWSDAMADWIPQQTHASYRWERDLGGFRKPSADSRHTALRNASFRAYADYMETDCFTGVVRQLLARLEGSRSAVMCSETLWWRCHRRLIADAMVLLHGVEVGHLFPDGKVQPHVLTQGVRRDGGVLRYDGAAA